MSRFGIRTSEGNLFIYENRQEAYKAYRKFEKTGKINKKRYKGAVIVSMAPENTYKEEETL